MTAKHLAAVAVLVLLGPILLPETAAAQRLSLRPQIGIYIPTKDLVAVSQGGAVGKIEAGPSFGAAIALRFGSHFGIEASGAYVPTTFSLDAGNQVQKQDAKLFLGDATAVLYVLPPSSILSLWLRGGVGVVSHGGVAFTSAEDKRDISGVGGAGAGIRLGGIMLTAGADLFSYKASFDESPQTSSSELRQLDIQVKFGFGFGF